MKRFRDTKYLITDDGRVFSEHSGKFLKHGDNGAGYLFVYICHDGGKKSNYIHRLVAEVYLPNPENKPQVNHIDGDKSNNHVSNLEWCTDLENQRHAISQGLNNCKGENHHAARLSKNDIIDIFKLKGKKSQREIGEIYGIHQNHVSRIHNKKRWAHITNNLKN